MNELKKKLIEESTSLVTKLNSINQKPNTETTKISNSLSTISLNERKSTKKRIKSKRILSLITQLTSLFLQLREFVSATNRRTGHGEGQNNMKSIDLFLPYYSKLINETITEIRKNLMSKQSSILFEDKVQVHINHIESTLSHYNRLHAFRHDFNKSEDLANNLLIDSANQNGSDNQEK